MLTLFANEKNFILIGYSFGSMMTLKIAKLLENNEKSGKVLLIDGSPKFIHQLSNQLVPSDASDEQLQEIILFGCIKLLFRESAQEMIKKIFSNQTMESKLEAFLVHAKDYSMYSSDYGRQMINGLLQRFKISLNSDKISFSKLINSTLTLIKPSEMSLLEIENDYGLKEFVDNDVGIKLFEGDHVSILSNPNLVEYVNEVIDIN